MNIFVLDKQPHLAARYHCDKHVVKMCLEYAQILCTISNYGYKPTHARHPCVLWAAENAENAFWLAYLLSELGGQYKARYGKEHASVSIGLAAYAHTPKRNAKLTPFAQAMPEHYKNKNAVKAYRSYYLGEKSRFATWRNGAPEWWREVL